MRYFAARVRTAQVITNSTSTDTVAFGGTVTFRRDDVQRLERDDVLAAGQYHPPDRNLVHLADGFADHGEGVVPDLAVRAQVVGAGILDAVTRISVELVEADLFGIGRGRIKSAGQVTSERRRKPFQLARGGAWTGTAITILF
jgi:hypothetical protein